MVQGALAFQLLMWAIRPVPVPEQHDDDDDEEDEEPRFIPFPLTTIQHEPEPYTLDDPEWREFVRISRDKEFQKEMRGRPSAPAALTPPTANALSRSHGQSRSAGGSEQSPLYPKIWARSEDKEILDGS